MKLGLDCLQGPFQASDPLLSLLLFPAEKMMDWRTVLTPSKRTHEFMHAWLSERAHSVRCWPCHLDNARVREGTLCFLPPWALLHRQCLQAGACSSLSCSHTSRMCNQSCFAVVLIKRTKSPPVAVNAGWPYTSGDPWGGPTTTASTPARLLIDLPS